MISWVLPHFIFHHQTHLFIIIPKYIAFWINALQLPQLLHKHSHSTTCILLPSTPWQAFRIKTAQGERGKRKKTIGYYSEGKAEEEIELEEKGLSTDLSEGIVCKKIHEEPVDARGYTNFFVGATNNDGDVNQMGWEDDEEGGGLMDLLPCHRSSINDSNKRHHSDPIESHCSLPFVGPPLPLQLLDNSLALKVTAKRIMPKRKHKFGKGATRGGDWKSHHPDRVDQLSVPLPADPVPAEDNGNAKNSCWGL